MKAAPVVTTARLAATVPKVLTDRRDLSVIDKEHFRFLKELIALEESEENEEIRSEFLSLSPQEREFRGKALLGLSVEERSFSPAEHILVTFVKPEKKALPLFSLDIGDIVSVFPEGRKVSELPSGTVYEKTPDSITVAFNQAPPDWLEEPGTVQLHKATNRVTYKRMREALDSVLETENTRLAILRDISLGLRKARLDDRISDRIDWFDDSLNDPQKRSVLKCLMAKDVALVHGPPGTGKTTALVELIRQTIKLERSVFATAPSNTACDNILERLIAKGVRALRLGHPARISESLREHTLDFKLALHPLAEHASRAQGELSRLLKKGDRYRDRRSPGYEAERELKTRIYDLKDEIRALRKEVFLRVLKDTEVFVGTPSSIQDRSIRDTFFDLIIIDEATQATEPLTWVPMLKADKVVMAGDHFQLPPTVRCKEAEDRGLGVTLFERFYDILGEDSKELLRIQYRMNEKIMGFSSRIFYKELLIAHESVKDRVLADLPEVAWEEATKEPLLFIDTAGKGFEERLEEGSESRFNPDEAQIVLDVLKRMVSLGVQPGEIAVISPYSAQVRLLASLSPDPGIEIDSVDGFQGREKELVIVSLVRSNVQGELGFLADTRRMNVAMTRARRKLVVIGDSATLSSIDFYKQFIEYAEKHGGYRTIWELE